MAKKGDLRIKVGFEGKPEEKIEVVAYAFDRQGNFLSSAPLKEGEAHLVLEEQRRRRARIFLGPPLPEGGQEESPTLKMMERFRAYEAVWKFDPGLEFQELLPIPEVHWHWWWWCLCRVRGRVVRPVEIGGTVQDLPVCHARVHICEVDRLPWLILRLRDDLIFRLRDDLIRYLERPWVPPKPLPDPPFKFDPGVIDPSPINIAQMNRAAGTGPVAGPESRMIRPQPEPPGADVGARAVNPQPEPTRIDLGVRALGPQPEPPDMPQLASLTIETKAALMSNSVKVVKQALIDHVQLIYPFLCYWDWLWWWWRYECDEIVTLETDGQGRFDTHVWYLCSGDHPDLYFWVEYQIGGVWTTVYRPIMACNTYWNYACGQEVTIRITDPRVPPCDEPPDLSGLQIAVMSIGNRVSIAEIQDSTAGADEGLTDTGQPFGGKLEPHVWFSRSALIGTGVNRYRWSYRKIEDSDGSAVTDIWHGIDRTVIRHYAVIDPVTSDLSFPADVMGPDGDNLFRIQPIDPPAPGIDWVTLDAREDTATAHFRSHLLEGGDAEQAAGKYELKLELFDNAGNLVNLTDQGIQVKIANEDAPFGTGTVTTTLASDEYLIRDGSGDVVAFKLVLHVDNCPCEAEIYPLSGAGLSVDPNCGYIEYPPGANAVISFKARHPNNLADFWFYVHRGTSIQVPQACAAGGVGDSPVNGFVRDVASVFTKTVAVNTLLTSNTPAGKTPCDKAAFAETLHVWPRATDGWNRLWYLRADGIPSAFALAPGS